MSFDLLSARDGRRPLWVAVPLVLIAVITLVDVLTPPQVRLSPFLVVAPAITASFAGARLTAAVAALALGAEVAVDMTQGPPALNQSVATLALAAVSAVVVFFAYLRDQYARHYRHARSLALTAQKAVLRPLPERAGPLHIASVYLAAEAEAVIGGDLYAAARRPHSTRLMIGDVRGKGLDAVGEAALVLGAFHATAHREPGLPTLAAAVDGALAATPRTPDRAAGEDFVTALLLDVPDDAGPISCLSCGHPPPLVIRDGHPVEPALPDPAPPLGLGLATAYGRTGSFPLGPDDVVLLCTDGVLEARDRAGAFYPLPDRIRTWPRGDPQSLVSFLRADLLHYTGGGNLGDDAALVAFRRGDSPDTGRTPREGPP
ncbi:PP2C family protein-serine/threonine phosphatase [Streptomyces sp. NPDC059861]|uniref:PP2C family protein-serine/threonine phosphatase n=1 Tax=Streptomyces sp. NPDC059861 TaxID=3346974 RepID=UPI00364F539A